MTGAPVSGTAVSALDPACIQSTHALAAMISPHTVRIV